VPAIGCLVDLVLDCADVEVLARFWADVLGRQVRDRQDGWISLGPGEDGHRLSFQQVRDYRPPQGPGQIVPQQMHLDVLVDDLETADAQVLALGATALTDILDPGRLQWRIYSDPAGHVLLGHQCAVTRSLTGT